jgi:putative ABC transport system permease protein
VAALLADNPEVGVRSQADFLAQLTSQVNTSVVLLYVLLGLSIVIAVLGIVNTLVLSILERTRELGLVRAVGMGRAQVIQLVTVESVVIAVFGALLGVLVGTALGTAVARALRDQFIPVLSLPWGSMVVFLALAVIVGLAAAVFPAVRAARTDVLRAIAYE